MRKILYIALLLQAANLQAQESGEDTLLRKNSLLPLPVVGYSPEKGFEFGAALYFSFYADKRNPTLSTRNSTLQLSSTFSTEKQYKVDLKADIWSSGNRWHIQPQLRYHDSPFNFYGLGDTALKSQRSRISNEQYKISLVLERLVWKNVYAGLSFLYQKDAFSAVNAEGIYPTAPLTDKEGGYVTFLGGSLVFDNRDNQNYTRTGGFVRLHSAHSPAVWSKRELTTVMVDGRYFWPLSGKLTLGTNAVYNTIQGEELPFYWLPNMGSDQIMRGYQGGRYRDQSYLAMQTELRFFIDPKIRIKLPFLDDTPTFAMAAFGGLGSVFPNGSFQTSRLKPTYGLGLRYFYDEASGITLRLDYGWGEQRAGEGRQGAFYLSVGEAF